MRESFFSLSSDDRRDVLRVDAVRGAPAPFILEKDLWVVWTLQTLFGTALADHLTFKGGTSLSKVYRIIERFSEDVDVTVDIRHLIPELAGTSPPPLPTTPSQAKKWRNAVEQRLDHIIDHVLIPAFNAAAERDDQAVLIEHAPAQVIILHVPFVSVEQGLANTVRIELGGRSTGSPRRRHRVACDLATYRPQLALPHADAHVMHAERTFWEKATAVHVFCRQEVLSAARLARHWYDLRALDRAGVADRAIADRALALEVADHKNVFFREKNANGRFVDYRRAVAGHLQLVPTGRLRAAVQEDYEAMLATQMFAGTPPTFERLISDCEALQARTNAAMRG